MTRIFISHQKADSLLAGKIADRLTASHRLDYYLDIIDPDAGKAGDLLGEYIRDQLGKCTQLMAVVSASTKESWWVPWEIGIATEKDQPIATFAGDKTVLPEYLKKWPYLQTDRDLDAYAEATNIAAASFRTQRTYITESAARRNSTKEFYKTLRSKLGR